MKVIRPVKRYIQSAQLEMDYLKFLQENPRVVTLQDSFMQPTTRDQPDSLCMVFPRHGPSLYNVLKRNCYIGLHIHNIQVIARQALEALQQMHEQARVVHTDLKPENILIRDESALVEIGEVKHLPRQYKEAGFVIAGS